MVHTRIAFCWMDGRDWSLVPQEFRTWEMTSRQVWFLVYCAVIAYLTVRFILRNKKYCVDKKTQVTQAQREAFRILSEQQDLHHGFVQLPECLKDKKDHTRYLH